MFLGANLSNGSWESLQLPSVSGFSPRRQAFVCAPCTPLTCVFVQGLEENLREAQAAAQRLETHLKQKEKLYEDKIKVGEPESLVEIFICAFAPSQSL